MQDMSALMGGMFTMVRCFIFTSSTYFILLAGLFLPSDEEHHVAGPSPKNKVTHNDDAESIATASLEGQFESIECHIAATHRKIHTYGSPPPTMQAAPWTYATEPPAP